MKKKIHSAAVTRSCASHFKTKLKLETMPLIGWFPMGQPIRGLGSNSQLMQSITYYLVLVGHRKYIFSDQTLHARASIMILERHQLSVSGFFKELQNDILCNSKLCNYSFLKEVYFVFKIKAWYSLKSMYQYYLNKYFKCEKF